MKHRKNGRISGSIRGDSRLRRLERTMQRTGSFSVFLWAAMACLGMAVIARAEAGAPPQGDANAVRAAAREFLGAARRGDEGALRKMWTPAGDFADASGKVLKAAELIHQLAALPKADAGATDDSISDATLRFVTPDVAIIDGMTDRACETDGSILTRRFTAVWVKREGKWLLDSLREAAVEASPLNEHLKPLEWLVGEWVGTTDDASILVSSHWCDEGNFVVREFAFARDGGGTISGTQRIGWDAINGKIKSWTFDSQGGAGEENWRRDGKRWIVDTVDVTADGKKGKTSSVYVPGDENHFVWEVAGADVAGVPLKPVRVEFRRAAEDE
jgi:hypothetical protein